MTTFSMYNIIPISALIFLQSVPIQASTVRYPDSVLCEIADWVLVGKTLSATASKDTSGMIITTAIVQVERIAHGTPPSQITVSTMGGVYNGQTYTVGGAPVLDPGSRHLFLLSTNNGQSPKIIGGMDQGAIRLNPTVTLPTNEELEDEWELRCE